MSSRKKTGSDLDERWKIAKSPAHPASANSIKGFVEEAEYSALVSNVNQLWLRGLLAVA